ncbi:MAG: hypothetical protein JWM80_3627, partial [Cyanobacteria bacterium RYN_339]|nr:hypothetical protein [Cyanobacteria bacterium RYN_339]
MEIRAFGRPLMGARPRLAGGASASTSPVATVWGRDALVGGGALLPKFLQAPQQQQLALPQPAVAAVPPQIQQQLAQLEQQLKALQAQLD